MQPQSAQVISPLKIKGSEEQKDILKACYQRLMDADPEVHMSMARALMRYQLLNTNNSPSLEVVKQVLEDDRRVLSLVRNFVHYNFHQCFLQPNQVLANLSKITHRPCMIIHGSLDDVCPLELASLVHENWQNSELLMSF